ncbi:MAG: RNA 2'-phosphotransferase [Deltaproteobacteria bacterium]
MRLKKELVSYAKFLAYVLGRRPDEFGLAPDPNGFVKIKEFLKAVTEEDGWGFFRKSHIDEMLVSLPDPPFELEGAAIRAKNRENLITRSPETLPPKLLYTAIRQKAYPVVIQKGIRPMGRRHVVLSSKKEMADRIGKRFDSHPVLLTVQTEKARKQGNLFLRSGDELFLSSFIPTECFSGPPLPKEPEKTAKKDIAKPVQRDNTPGSFFPELQETPHPYRSKKQRREKEISWKKARKRQRRR